MESKSYLAVFIAEVDDLLIKDVGDDPCFANPPTWGICRPPTRRMLKVGDTMFFLGKRNNVYILKGWFEVGEKIDYISALSRFPKRANVIIGNQHRNKANQSWRHIFAPENTNELRFLKEIDVKEGVYYQSQTDEHQLDNWKCRRIFHCNKNQFTNCLSNLYCQKSGVSIKEKTYSNYVVANPEKWDDVAYLNIDLSEMSAAIGFNKPVRTPYNQHNVLHFDEYKTSLLEYIEKRKQNHC
ncbi:hypothetical protein FPZ43_05905 [Mucilaginibacter pallidiroseus]|uniref:Nucleotide modification associated domain-containing protein n=1 Tax=Mucilaginibacter pallidiroseus TaxID=2599295 RepID=A0A563UGQ4_9SPHI|nr:hypothetical protein [Mucilaginibacter pallidiroseus]TWR30473.1 hypothetical protein FPZ43_05905 [Mucilaginibacter pallidiroseus]